MKQPDKEWAAINGNLVVGIYVATESAAQQILSPKYDVIVDVTDMGEMRPDKGWIYENGTFTKGEENAQ